MQQSTGNIFDKEEIEKFQIPEEDLIPLTEDEYKKFLKTRKLQANKLARRKKNKKAKSSRKRNRKT